MAILVLVAAWQSGLVDLLSEPERARETILGLGALGLLAFVVAYAVVQPLGFSGMAFVVVAPLIWPWPVAFAASMTGTLAATALGFSVSRFVARDWVSSRIPQRFRAWEGTLERRGFITVLTLRVLFLMQPMLHAFFGVSRVSFWTHLGASALAYVVPIFLISRFGAEVFAFLREAPLSAWLGFGAAVLASIAVRHLLRRRARRRAAASAGQDVP